jgi:hypothetical protein
MMRGITNSWQTGLGPNRFKKLHSFLVASEAACSKGDFPVVTVEATLTAVLGLATAAVAAVPPTALAALVPALPMAANGRAQPDKKKTLKPIMKA